MLPPPKKIKTMLQYASGTTGSHFILHSPDGTNLYVYFPDSSVCLQIRNLWHVIIQTVISLDDSVFYYYRNAIITDIKGDEEDDSIIILIFKVGEGDLETFSCLK